MFKEAVEDMCLDVFQNLKNGVLIMYGQSKSGKSLSLFGEQKSMQIGIMQMTIDRYFE